MRRDGDRRAARPALVLFAVAWTAAQILGHAASSPAAARRTPRTEGSSAAGAAPRPRSPRRSSAGSAPPTPSVRPPCTYGRRRAGADRDPARARRSSASGAIVQGGISCGPTRDAPQRHRRRRRERNRRRARRGRDARPCPRLGARAWTESTRAGAGVMIDDCSISSPAGPLVAGHRRSRSRWDLGMSMVAGCTISGDARRDLDPLVDGRRHHNHVIGTTERAITLAEMSMGMVEPQRRRERARDRHHLHGSLDVRDRAQHRRRHAGRRRTQNPTRGGVAIEAHFFAEAKVHHNTVVASPGGVRRSSDSTITR